VAVEVERIVMEADNLEDQVVVVLEIVLLGDPVEQELHVKVMMVEIIFIQILILVVAAEDQLELEVLQVLVQ
tara:strand:+ start:95 stop:310 length:216 start_codon:yes stop_codon:yes gene_type:complete